MVNFPNFVFFGTDRFAVIILETLATAGISPELIVTISDQSPVKIWAEKNKIPHLQPADLRSALDSLQATNYKLFLVASYGKLIPPSILNLPKYGTLNIHPSLLPAYRGPTPIQTAILDGVEKSGVTLMLLDKELDHGPTLQTISYKLQARNSIETRNDLARIGARLFTEVAPKWVEGKIKAVPQDHTQATFTKKIKKGDGLINLSDNPLLNYRKFLAYQAWPGTYFFTERNSKRMRVIITAAHIVDNQFIVDRVKPEGKKDMPYSDFQRGFKFN